MAEAIALFATCFVSETVDGLIHFSKRVPAVLTQSDFAAAVEGHRRSDQPLLDLTVSNPTQTMAEYPHRQLAASLGLVHNFTYEPDPLGWQAARENIAGLYQKRGIHLGADRIALTASTSEAYSLLFKLLCDPGDEVLVPIPSYPLFEHLAHFDAVRVQPYPLRYDGAWHIDFAALEEHCSERTRAIVVVNPNNPTGSFLKREEAVQLVAWAGRNGLAVLSDEVFLDYRWTAAAHIVESLGEFPEALSFSLNGLSKSCAMPQMKLAWIAMNGPEQEIAELRLRLELILDTYLSVNTPVQKALPSLLEIGSHLQAQLSATIRSNLAFLQRATAAAPAQCLTVEGGWTAILQLPRICPEEEWVTVLLRDHSVLVQPGYYFDMSSEPYTVVSLITPSAIFEAGIERLLRCVSERSQES